MKLSSPYHLAVSRHELMDWRHDFHMHPETAFEEFRTASVVASKLREFDLEVAESVGKTGVVGTLVNGDGPAIALRADMDALHIEEQNALSYRSKNVGKMHACGHDGHTTMLLGAAKHLANTRRFSGTVQFIFQPAEENEAGAKAMIDDGLFDRFPAERIFAMHNWPGLQVGEMAVCTGPIMAAFDTFSIEIIGDGGHAAMPHMSTDCIVAAGYFLTAIQTIVSRFVDPQMPSVISVTQIHGGDTWNVLPSSVKISGTTRHFHLDAQDRIINEITNLVEQTGEMFKVKTDLVYSKRYPATVNSKEEVDMALEAAGKMMTTENINPNCIPSMASEDFAFFLGEKPGCFMWFGNGTDEVGGKALHSSNYDFNDDLLEIGTAYWVKLVETLL